MTGRVSAKVKFRRNDELFVIENRNVKYRIITLLLGKSTINNIHHTLQSQWRLGNVGWQHNFSFSSWSRSENEILISTRKTRVQGQNQQVWKLKQSGCIRNQNLQPQLRKQNAIWQVDLPQSHVGTQIPVAGSDWPWTGPWIGYALIFN